MNVAALIKRLQTLDPETIVAKFADGEGYDECWFLDGTHTGAHFNGGEVLKANRTKRVKGKAKADFLCVQAAETKAKTVPFLVIY